MTGDDFHTIPGKGLIIRAYDAPQAYDAPHAIKIAQTSRHSREGKDRLMASRDTKRGSLLSHTRNIHIESYSEGQAFWRWSNRETFVSGLSPCRRGAESVLGLEGVGDNSGIVFLRHRGRGSSHINPQRWRQHAQDLYKIKPDLIPT